jgi:tRNA threonylcarbamoyladenosine biosynthesis protein TsaB
MAARFLLVDTCGRQGMVALGEGDAVVAEAAMPGRTYSERLVAEGMRLLRERGWRLAEIGAMVVVTGPGSFTGVRVGLSAVKGWSEAAGVPVIGLSRLVLLARLALLTSADGEAVHAVLDAGRSEFYHGEYRGGRCLREVLQTREQMLRLDGRMVVCEETVAEALLARSPMLVAEPGGIEILRLGRERFAAGEFADAVTLDANYVRRTDAEIFAKPVAKRVTGDAAP